MRQAGIIAAAGIVALTQMVDRLAEDHANAKALADATDACWQAILDQDVATFGQSLLTTYLVPFEVAGVLLMIVMVGAAHLARQES